MELTQAEANLLKLIRLTRFGKATLTVQEGQPRQFVITDLTFRCDLDLEDQGITLIP